MGGLGSGAKRSTHIGDVEDNIAIDIRSLRRLRLIQPGECVIDTIHWSIGGHSAPSARLRIDLSDIERGGTMIARFKYAGHAIEQQIPIEAAQSRFGGWRCYFICPETAQRCEILYYADGRFASRKSQKLSYASQNMGQLDRARRKVAKLRMRLDGKNNLPRPRGSNRSRIAATLACANFEARSLYRERLQNMVGESGAR